MQTQASGQGEKILLLGDQRLRVVCEPVTRFADSEFRHSAARLMRALEQFRTEHGFGRAIAAPQIGIPLRMIAMNLGQGPFVLVNPALSGFSRQRFTMWDDCMSFPWLMVRVERHLHLDLSYVDEEGKAQNWNTVAQSLSELLQHEVDHLDGILAIDRALDREALIARSVYQAQRAFFDAQVDYVIEPTTK